MLLFQETRNWGQREWGKEAIPALLEYLATLPAGMVEDRDKLIEYLFHSWRGFWGASDTGMDMMMLEGMEVPAWNPPLLSFVIERPGGVIWSGPTPPELQEWVVDTETLWAKPFKNSYREVRLRAPSFHAKPAVDAVIALVEAQSDDRNLEWSKERDKVTILVRKIVPRGSSKTVEGRIARFRAVLEDEMAALGWTETSSFTFQREVPGQHTHRDS